MKACPFILAIVLGSAPASLVTAQTTVDPAPTNATSQPVPRIILSQVIHDTDYRRAEPERLIVLLHLLPDPALPVVYSQRMVAADKAVDDKGNSLALEGPVPSTMDPFAAAPISDLAKTAEVVLRPTPANVEPGKMIQFIEGAIPAAIAVKTETISFTVPGNEKHTYPGNIRTSFAATMTGDTSCKVDISIDIPKGVPSLQQKVWSNQFDITADQKMKVTDANSVQWSRGGASGGSGASAGQYHETLNFSAPADSPPAAPLKVSFELVTEIKSIAIPFRVENIPLP